MPLVRPGMAVGPVVVGWARHYKKTAVLHRRENRRPRWASMLLAAVLAAPAAASAQDWLISVLDGEAVVVDGLRRLTATAGQRLEPGAIIETTAKTAVLRLESSDQSTYDLGPDTRAMLAPPGFPARGDRTPQLYLMQGWVKGVARGPREAAGVLTPALELMPFKGAVVVLQQKREQMVFVESGRTDVVERRVGEFIAPASVRRPPAWPCGRATS